MGQWQRLLGSSCQDAKKKKSPVYKSGLSLNRPVAGQLADGQGPAVVNSDSWPTSA
jgi:hypothetical protein